MPRFWPSIGIEVFKSTERDEVQFGIIPVENSLEGSISQSYDLLLDSNLKVCGEIELRVVHCLIANPGARLDSIKRVYSHPQALGQCKAFLKHLDCELIPTYDTAGSVKMIKEKGITDGGAIASARAAEIYEMKVLAEEFPFRGNGVLYWAGCSTSYRLPGIIEATTNVFQKVGLDFGLLGEKEGCCSLILYLLGLWDEARVNALETSARLVEIGVKQLVTSCAGCFYAFTKVYSTLGVSLPLEIRHTSQLFESLIRGDGLRLEGLKGRLMWHDPCDLGRHCNVYDPPRNVLASIPGLEIAELPLNRRHALCCGGGGGLMMYDISLSEKVAHSKIIEELTPLGIDGVVTGCPACILSLRNAAKTLGEEIDIYDLSEIVDRCV